MALKAVHVSDVPSLDQVTENAASLLRSPTLSKRVDAVRVVGESRKFEVIGHRGSGMNILHSPDRRMKAIRENTVRSFNAAATFPVDFVEFDVQVTKDDCPVIFHDNFILTKQNETMCEKRLTELTLSEFLTYGPQKDSQEMGKSLVRKSKDGRIFEWDVAEDDTLCTLQEAFEKVDPSLGFNIELKFDDNVVYPEQELTHVLQAILKVVSEYAKDRPIIFSSFQPDAVRIIKKLQDTYPVFFLTNGGNEIYTDVRRNSVEDAIEWCLECGLQGIVSEVKGIFRNPSLISKIKESNLSLMTYGQLNNVPEAVYMQHLIGVDGVIVDFVREITEAVSDFIEPREQKLVEDGIKNPKFSQLELSFLLKLIPELIRH
ncbi:hypothetical protein Sjap_016577 [Stephania japonica]|uniref:glycerophosphodiester phosphodiesterase n=1 Tax=Stephania japonica TaxID=461633 RepID=A0AAP0IM56_9MAGN